MKDANIQRRNTLKKIALLSAGAALTPNLASAADGPVLLPRADRERADEVLSGLWNVTVTGSNTYLYLYSFSRGGFVAAGNIDNNWDGQGSSFGPTLGAHTWLGSRTYDIREKGYAFDPQGMPAGSFGFAGTYTVDETGQQLTGDGTWTLYDLAGDAVWVEAVTVEGTKLN